MHRKGSLEQSGDDSQFYQSSNDIVVNNYGMSPTETALIVRELVRGEMQTYVAAGREETQNRLAHFERELIARFEMRPELTFAMQDPDVQHYTSEAAKGFIRTGEQPTADLLLDLLVDRCQEPSRTIQAAVLDQALAVAGLLTDVQLDILTAVWLITRVRFGAVSSPQELAGRIRDHIVPFLSRLPNTDGPYVHLDFLRCATVSVLENKLSELYRTLYPGLFTNGYDWSEARPALPGDWDKFVATYTIQCLWNPSNLQINAVAEDGLRATMSANGETAEMISAVVNLQKGAPRTNEEMEAWLRSIDGAMYGLLDRWEETSMRFLKPTSVGMAIAHANARRLTDFSGDLSIWIA